MDALTAYDRIAVQLTEIRRLILEGSISRARLALLLIDNAAETLLRASAQDGLAAADMYTNALGIVTAHAGQGDAEADRLVLELSSRTVSKTKRRAIDRDFGTLVDYVAQQSDNALGEPFAEALKVLHRYRNAAYHRDHINAEVLGPAVRIYAFLVGHLLTHRPWHFRLMGSSEPVPAGVQEFLAGEADCASWRNLDERMAARLLRDLIVDNDHITHELSQHISGRISDLEGSIDEIAAFYGWTAVLGARRARELALRVAQLTEDELKIPEPPEDLWTRKIPIDSSTFSTWRSDAVAITQRLDALEALIAFATLEGQIEALEGPVDVIEVQMEREVQEEFDRRRGK